jgi:hypothetical protein
VVFRKLVVGKLSGLHWLTVGYSGIFLDAELLETFHNEYQLAVS